MSYSADSQHGQQAAAAGGQPKLEIMGSRGFNVDTWLEAVEAQAALSGAQAAE